MQLNAKTIGSGQVKEVYITISAAPGEPVGPQNEQKLFQTAHDYLKSEGLHIFQERVFGTDAALARAQTIRSRIFADLDEKVPPTWLSVPEGASGTISGIQIHALQGCAQPEVVVFNGQPIGRIARHEHRACISISGITTQGTDLATGQTEGMFQQVEDILKKFQLDMFLIARTWMWLGDILDWYDDFNQVRNHFFAQRNLIGQGATGHMPASTGIGIGPTGDRICTMDCIGIVEPKNSIKYLDVSGNQHSAYDYGSAFSRATLAPTLSADTLFISGTASIDQDGKTTHLNDYPAQIADTIDNIRTILKQQNFSDVDMVHSIVYCKTAEIENYFRKEYPDFPWPHFTAIADVCRDNLLFEIEATAAR